MSDWIKCGDRLPEIAGDYICFFDNGKVIGFDYCPRLDSDGWGYHGKEQVTHWMPLPEPPEDQ